MAFLKFFTLCIVFAVLIVSAVFIWLPVRAALFYFFEVASLIKSAQETLNEKAAVPHAKA